MDRFLLRIICTCVKDEQTFYNMLLDDNDKEINVPSELQISEEEYADWHGQINRISLSAEICTTLLTFAAN